jgi:2-dehydropantoate 2-reductase
MRILVFGAGALGTLYAARLAMAGNEVALLARGRRLEALREGGVRIRPRGSRTLPPASVRVVERMTDSSHDLVIVLVRRHQVDEALRGVTASRDASDVLMMVNVASGYETWRAALGARLLVGFAGAVAGLAPDGVLEYEVAPALFQPTVLGEPAGPPSERVHRVARALADAGFPVQTRDDMEDWQYAHAAWITPFMLVTAVAARDPDRLKDKALLRLWMGATKEGVRLVREARGRVTPRALSLVAGLPAPWLAAISRGVLAPRRMRERFVSAGHDSRTEGLALAAELAAAAAQAGLSLPDLERLRSLATA